MRFFTMEQDKMLQDMAKLRDFDICGPRHIFFRRDAAVIKPSTTLYFAADSGEALPDFIQSPIPLVSDMVKKVLDVYEDDMIFRSVSLERSFCTIRFCWKSRRCFLTARNIIRTEA